MVIPPLPYELWARIIALLQNEKPAALSCPPRSQLRQPTLAILSRVSVMFASICNDLLYTHIVHDDLPLLFANLREPRMRSKFCLTKSLNIEYAARGQGPTYLSIFRTAEAAWQSCGLHHHEMQELIMVECADETKEFRTKLELGCSLGGARALFPNLETIAISSTYGKETDAWQRYDKVREKLADTVPEMENGDLDHCHRSKLMFTYFLSGSHLQHLCIRDPMGPLSLILLSFASDNWVKPIQYTQTVHLPPTIDALYFPLGTRVRFTCEASSTDDLAVILKAFIFYLSDRINHRRHVAESHSRRDVLDVEVFCSTKWLTPALLAGDWRSSVRAGGVDFNRLVDGWDRQDTTCHALTEKQEQQLVLRMSALTNLFLRNISKLSDRVKWSASDLTPICEACGSGAMP